MESSNQRIKGRTRLFHSTRKSRTACFAGTSAVPRRGECAKRMERPTWSTRTSRRKEGDTSMTYIQLLWIHRKFWCQFCSMHFYWLFSTLLDGLQVCFCSPWVFMSLGLVMLLPIGSLCISMVILHIVNLKMTVWPWHVKTTGHLAFWQFMTSLLHFFSPWRLSTQSDMDLVNQQRSASIWSLYAAHRVSLVALSKLSWLALYLPSCRCRTKG